MFSTWIIELGLALVYTTASGMNSIMRETKNNLLKQAHMVLTIRVLNKYVAKKQRKLRTSIYNVIVIMFKPASGYSFCQQYEMSFKHNRHEVYQNYNTLCHFVRQVRAQNIFTCVAKTSNV